MMNLIEGRILGFVSDTGGNNARLNMLLRNGKEIGNRLWLEDEDITFQDSSTFRKNNDYNVAIQHTQLKIK